MTAAAIRMRSLYTLRRTALQCTKCGKPSDRAVCTDCSSRRFFGFPNRAAFIEADRREEMLALSEVTALHRIGGPCE